MNVDSAGSVGAPRAGRREWLGLAVIALPCVLYSMDLTVLNLAVPSLSIALRPTSSQLLWIIDIYGFMVAGFLITMGNLGDRIGRRKLLLIGAAAFGIGSVLAAFSTTASMLIATRALLGIAGATLAPSTLSLIRNMFHDAAQRSVAVGVWITSYTVGAAIGPFVGGVLLQYFWWGSVLLAGVPVMLLLLALGPYLLPEFRDPGASPLDLLSAAMSLVSVLAVVYGLKLIAQDGLHGLPVAAIAAGLLLGFAFLRRQTILATPLIDLRLFRFPTFSAALVMYLLATFTAFGSYVFMAQHLQLVAGLSPLQAGLWTLPWAASFIVGSNLTPALVRRFSQVSVLKASLIVAAIGFAIVTQIDRPAGLAIMVAGSIVYSLGLAPVFTLANDMILAAAPPERAGAAAAISETSSELGGAVGIAILGSIGTAVYRRSLALTVPNGVPAEVLGEAKSTLGGALAVAEQLPAGVGTALVGAARDAFVSGFELTMAICVAISIASAILVMIQLRRSGGDEPAADAALDRI